MRRVVAGLVAAAMAGTVFVSGSASADSTLPAWCADQSHASILGAFDDTGYGSSGYPSSGTQTYARTPFGWTTRLSDNLKAQWGTVVANRAHNGALVSDYLPGGRWPDTSTAVADMASSRPSLVIIDLGGNEYYAQHDPQTFATQLAALVDDVRVSTPGATILLGAYAELKRPAPTTYPWATYVDKIRSTAVAKGTAMMDLRRYIPAAATATQPAPTPWLADGIHLNDAGNLAEFAAYWGWVAARIGTC